MRCGVLCVCVLYIYASFFVFSSFFSLDSLASLSHTHPPTKLLIDITTLTCCFHSMRSLIEISLFLLHCHSATLTQSNTRYPIHHIAYFSVQMFRHFNRSHFLAPAPVLSPTNGLTEKKNFLIKKIDYTW